MIQLFRKRALRQISGMRSVFVVSCTLAALAQLPTWPCLAVERHAPQRRPTIWVWDCKSAPFWRETLRTSSIDVAHTTASRFNRQYNGAGKFYAVTEGETPETPANCDSNLSFSAGLPTDVGIDGILAAPPSQPAKTASRAGTKSTARSASSKPATGKLVLLNGPRHQMGVISQGEAGTHVFEVRNSGTAELTLRLRDKSCGCTTVRVNGTELSLESAAPLDLELQPIPEGTDLPAPQLPVVASPANELPQLAAAGSASPTSGNDVHVIPAGGAARIEVSVDTSDARGAIHQRVRFATSDPDQPSVEFEVEGEVSRPIEVAPARINIEGLRADKSIRRTVRITSKKFDNLQIKEVKSSNPAFVVRADRLSSGYLKSEQLLAGFEVHVDIPAGQPIGLTHALIQIATNLPGQPVLTIPVMGRVEGDITLMPSDVLEFGSVPRGETAVQGVYGKIRTKVPVDIKLVRTEPDFLKVEIHKPSGLSQGQQFLIVEATLSATAPGGEFNGEIEIETTHPTSRRLRIPVHGQVIEESPVAAR